ncbi:MAG: hypothetical protein HZY76_11485 [Anaerolineae bacterium]|nr:MAG: hypothetical protein HZY76_11485 [Anaerolineae bacterium]
MNRFLLRYRFIVLAILVAVSVSLTACAPAATPAPAPAATTMDHTSGAGVLSSPAAQLQSAMQELWAHHMQWTYATVDAFFNNQTALEPTLNRLLQNQKDIGAAIAPYYGQDAANKLTELLTAHINGAVPVLTAAKAGDQAALDKAVADWYANAQEIADFLSAANPENWPQSATGPMMKGHIDTTVAYSVDLLKGDYAKAIQDYDEAYGHMMMLADILAKGIAAQFPDKVK